MLVYLAINVAVAMAACQSFTSADLYMSCNAIAAYPTASTQRCTLRAVAASVLYNEEVQQAVGADYDPRYLPNGLNAFCRTAIRTENCSNLVEAWRCARACPPCVDGQDVECTSYADAVKSECPRTWTYCLENLNVSTNGTACPNTRFVGQYTEPTTAPQPRHTTLSGACCVDAGCIGTVNDADCRVLEPTGVFLGVGSKCSTCGNETAVAAAAAAAANDAASDTATAHPFAVAVALWLLVVAY